MKKLILVPALAVVVMTTVLTRSQSIGQANDPFAAPENSSLPRMVRVHAEFIELPQRIYTNLMAGPRSSSNDGDLRLRCSELIAAREARIVESLSSTVIPGTYATSESIGEYVYPTEYEPPGQLIPPGGQPGLGSFPFPKPGSPPIPSPMHETKNTGSTLEVEVQIKNNAPIVDLRLTPSIVTLVDTIDWAVWKNKEVSVATSTPLFYAMVPKTGVTLVAGEPHMLCCLTPHDELGFPDPTRKIMLFIRADIITIGK